MRDGFFDTYALGGTVNIEQYALKTRSHLVTQYLFFLCKKPIIKHCEKLHC